jgi:hypothetical protein
MKITGQLKDDILTGKAVLFLGAGVSQAVGLLGVNELANYLFVKANRPTDYEKYKNDLPRLVAKLEKNPTFTRRWVDNKLKEYFLDSKNYSDLSHHKKIFQLHWKAIFTTNYDMSLEFAEYFTEQKLYRLLPIVNPKDNVLLSDTDPGKLKYYKIHGCCRELEQHPSDAPPLVITQKDFQDSISRNQPFLEELRRYAYGCSIVFIGFQAHRSENNPILASIQEACHSIASSFHQPFRPFAVLKDVDEDTISDLEDIGVTLIEGTFEEFVDAAILLKSEQEKRFGSITIEDKIYIKAAGKEIELTRAEYQQYTSQFTCYYEGYFEEKANKLNKLSQAQIIDLWKTSPSDMFLASGRYIKRTIFNDVVLQFKNAIKATAKTKSLQVFIIEGNRASGKSVIAKQLTHYAYSELNQPVLILSPQASYFDKPHGSAKEINVSGWDGRLIDKFLSLFYGNESGSDNHVVPILLADHLSYRQFALDHLLKYLENHGKPCVLILTLNPDEWHESTKDRLLQLYNYQHIHLEHKLDDDEISILFEKISNDEQRVQDKKDILLNRAKRPFECDRDILFILYMWFDKQFRRLDEIIAEEAEKLNSDPDIKNLYLSIAVFHQYNFTPRLSLCAESLNISINSFNNLKNNPIFKTFINLYADIEEGGNEFASTRHSEFSRKILNRLMPEIEKQVELMEKILKHAGQADIQFVRNFLNHLYRYITSFTIDQVTRLKEATEKKLGKDYVINHQFAAYLIREKVRLDDARYYLDIALQEDPDNASVIHSLGNLCFTLYKDELEKENIQKATEYFNYAKEYFFRSRALMNTRDEHAYFTDIDMTKYRITHAKDDKTTKVLLNAESQALTLEALRVVPVERQNLLRKIIGEGVPFRDLPVIDQNILIKQIMDGNASPILLEYYSESLLSRPAAKSWHELRKIVSLYGKTDSNIATAAVVGLISKKAFIKSAENRFEFLRGFYDKIVRYREAKMNFALLAEYIRLLLIDGLVLEKYEFLRAITGDIIDLFRESLPRFLKDEFILDKKYYIFDENNKDLLINLFENNSSDFYSHKKAKRFSRLVNLSGSERERYFRIELDPITGYFIRGVRKEIGTHSGRIELNFCIKHTYEGFIATDF